MQLFVLVSLEVIVVGEGEEVARGRRLRLTCSVVIVPMMVCDDVLDVKTTGGLLCCVGNSYRFPYSCLQAGILLVVVADGDRIK